MWEALPLTIRGGLESTLTKSERACHFPARWGSFKCLTSSHVKDGNRRKHLVMFGAHNECVLASQNRSNRDHANPNGLRVKGCADVLHSECCRRRGGAWSTPSSVDLKLCFLLKQDWVHLGSEFPSPGQWVYFEKQVHSCHAHMRHKCVPPSLQAVPDGRCKAPQMELSVLSGVAALSGWCRQIVMSLLLKVNMEIPTPGLFPMASFLHFEPVWPGRKHMST